jgi:hypothetical protein
MGIRFYFITIGIFLFSLGHAYNGDTIHSPLNIGVRSHYGFIIPHAKEIRGIAGSNPRGADLDVSWLLLGKNAWNYCFCYPRSGFTVSYMDFDNPDVLGKAYALNYFIEPFISYQNLINFSFRAGMGMTYLTNPYDSEKNPENLFYSSRLSFTLLLNLAINFRLSKDLNGRIAGYYNHISNAGIKEPNKGINYPTLSFGIDYMLQDYSIPQREKVARDIYERKNTLRLSIFGTAKTYSTADQTRYPVMGFSITGERMIGRVSGVRAGAELVTDHQLKENLQRRDISKDHNRAAILIGHNLHIGRFNFSQVLGIYLYSPFKAKDPVYQRWGFTYNVNKNVFVGINLKAHRHVADFMDIRLGYIF